MGRQASTARDTSIKTYRARRDFAATPEPEPRAGKPGAQAPIFVVQKHAARRLHWDFRLEHAGVLWSWAVPKGPSLDPADKRLAVRTEDHPLDYADFAGEIPAGQYGAGTVETWDRGVWTAKGDPEQAIAQGELKFALSGSRLNGGFVLVRLKPRPKDRTENWLLIKEHDTEEERGADAETLERRGALPAAKPARRGRSAKSDPEPPPAAGALRSELPAAQAPQLATAAQAPPEGAGWLSELKFDGYRLLAFKTGSDVRLLTRNGNDWTARLPSIARAVSRVGAETALLDGELVALREDGVTSFALLQQALSDGTDQRLFCYVFDLLYLDGWDLRPCPLAERKRVLQALPLGKGAIRYSDHVDGQAEAMRQHACELGLEGIICKQADAPYRAGRNRLWLKVKCQGREEFVILGFTPPAGQRTGIGSLHVGYYDPEGNLQYVGGVGTGFTESELAALRTRLDGLKSEPPDRMVYAGEPPERGITWVRPELIAEVRFGAWSGSGRIRHATYLGLREDKAPKDVVLPIADPDAERVRFGERRRSVVVQAAAPKKVTKAPARSSPAPSDAKPRPARTVVARRPEAGADALAGVKLTHADRELWPGVTKRDLADYWMAVADCALTHIAGRPLALVRCPEGIDGERFFQKHTKPGFPAQIRGGHAGKAPYLVLDDLSGLIACAQVSAIELHAWGSREDDAEHPDRLVFDLDPGEGVPFTEVIRAAFEVRDRLKADGLESFCRTTGGKGLHVVVPVRPRAAWEETRAWCRSFAEAMAAEQPDKYVSRLPKVERSGRILVDWLRNGLGSTAVASLSPRARPGATVATPLTWAEVNDELDPMALNLTTVPPRLKRKPNPWQGFDGLEQYVPQAKAKPAGPKRRG